MNAFQARTAPSTRQGRGRRLLAPAAAVGLATAAGAVLATVDPNEPGHFPTCPFLAISGWWCPGCGTLRATHALLHGDLGTALDRNPLTVVAYAVLLVALVMWTRRLWTGRERTWLAPAWVLRAMFWGLIVYWGLRNVPGWTWLSPA